jgi:hypothetical protein
VGLLNVVSPVSPSDGDNAQLGDNDGTSDSGGDFLGTLDTETDVTVEVTDGNESLESGSLTGRSLLLDGSDRHDLILQTGEELVDDLVLLDGEREEVDLLHGLDLSIVYQTTKLGEIGGQTSADKIVYETMCCCLFTLVTGCQGFSSSFRGPRRPLPRPEK